MQVLEWVFPGYLAMAGNAGNWNNGGGRVCVVEGRSGGFLLCSVANNKRCYCWSTRFLELVVGESASVYFTIEITRLASFVGGQPVHKRCLPRKISQLHSSSNYFHVQAHIPPRPKAVAPTARLERKIFEYLTLAQLYSAERTAEETYIQRGVRDIINGLAFQLRGYL